MVFSLSSPYLLLFIPPAVILLTVITVLNKSGKSKFQKYFSLIFRIIIVSMIILSLADFNIRKYTDETTTVFAVDLSASFQNNREKVLDFISKAIENKKENDKVGAVVFGENAVIEFMPELDREISEFNSYLNGEYTNISSALNISSAIIPDGSNKRIVLISDGLENIDSAAETAKSLKKRNIELGTYYIENGIENELQLTDIKVPKRINKDIKYEIGAEIYSLSQAGTKILIYKNNEIIVDENVTVRQGSNKFLFNDISDRGGMQIYRAEIQPLADAYTENNVLHSYGYVEDIPAVLVIGNGNSTDQIVNILSMSNVNITGIQAAEAPVSLERLSIYQSVILVDVAIDDLPAGFEDVLNSYVKTIGGGLIVTGGENSYALGGYQNTLLEDMLPVDMQLKDKENKPDLAMAIVIDRSGSMTSGKYGVSKLSLAKEAVMRSVDVLEQADSIGILAFDDKSDWVAEMQKIEDDKAAIMEDISHISVGGGTSILPALEEAYKALENYDAKLKHIILLTDGQAESAGYENLIKSMKDNSITLSCVAVGSDADTGLLQRLSAQGSGRYYFTDEFTDLPKIFVKETYMAGETFLNNYNFTPGVKMPSPILSDINALPYLDGYVSTMAKPRADVILASDKDEPVLASWQYGLGKTIAWTSDMNNMWTAQWLKNENGVTLFRNAVSWVLSKELNINAEADIERKGRDYEIILTVPFSESIKSINGVAVKTGDNEIPLSFEMVAPGVYKSNISSVSEGIYIANLELEKEASKEKMTIGIDIPYSQEFDVQNYSSGKTLMNKIAAESGGRIIKSAADVFMDFENDAFGEYSLSNILLVIALILVLLDIAARRFSFVIANIEKIFIKTLSALSSRPAYKNKDIKKIRKNDELDLMNEATDAKKKVNFKKTTENIKKQSMHSKTCASDELLNRMKNRKGE